jgi:hypothetical protein
MHVLPNRGLQIKKVSNLTHEEFVDFYRNQKPVIISDLCNDWKLFETRLDENSLRDVLDLETRENVFVSHDNLHFLAKGIVEEVNMSLSEVVNKIFSPLGVDNPRIYLRAPIYEQVNKDIVFPNYLLNENESFSHNLNGMWLSSPGNITPLHIDLWHGILVQVIGTKSVVLFSPEDTPYLYQNSSLSSNSHTCKIDLTKSTTSEFATTYPLFDEAIPYCALLLPGECLYIPPCWWHDVVSIDTCVSLTMRWNLQPKERIHACAIK